MLIWFIVFSAGLLANNAASFVESSLGEPYAAAMGVKFAGIALRTASGRSKQIDAAADEVWVEIRFGTARPDVEAHCGIGLMPRGEEGTGIRLELPEPLRFVTPRTYVLAARIPPGTLRPGAYDVRADAVVSNPDEPGASVIASRIGRVRIVGPHPDHPEFDEPPAPHWDGTVSWRAEAEWSVG